jgi:hypothetical protein
MNKNIKTLTILGGRSKSGEAEAVPEVVFHADDVVSIVVAYRFRQDHAHQRHRTVRCGDTPSKRTILIDGEVVPDEVRNNPEEPHRDDHPAHDLPVRSAGLYEFLDMHAHIRREKTASLVEETPNSRTSFAASRSRTIT